MRFHIELEAELGLGGLAGASLALGLFAWAGVARHAAAPVAAVLVIMLLAGLVAAASPARRGCARSRCKRSGRSEEMPPAAARAERIHGSCLPLQPGGN